MKNQVWYRLLLTASVLLSPLTNAFIPTRQLISSFIVRQSYDNPKTQLRESVEAEDVIGDTPTDKLKPAPNGLKISPQDLFPKAYFFTFEMPEHRPMGLTIEESLDPLEDYVFVSKIVPGGFAYNAGIIVGDVIVAVTGLFGDTNTMVLDSGVEKIKQLVAAVPDEDPLTFEIARGTGVLDRHETAIVDLCQFPGASDKETENCVVDYLAGGYADYDSVVDAEVVCDDDDDECLVDNMMNMWAEDLPQAPTLSDQLEEEEETKEKAKPWSSRSSGSGTYVLDPATGKMKNLDE